MCVCCRCWYYIFFSFVPSFLLPHHFCCNREKKNCTCTRAMPTHHTHTMRFHFSITELISCTTHVFLFFFFAFVLGGIQNCSIEFWRVIVEKWFATLTKKKTITLHLEWQARIGYVKQFDLIFFLLSESHTHTKYMVNERKLKEKKKKKNEYETIEIFFYLFSFSFCSLFASHLRIHTQIKNKILFDSFHYYFLRHYHINLSFRQLMKTKFNSFHAQRDYVMVNVLCGVYVCVCVRVYVHLYFAPCVWSVICIWFARPYKLGMCLCRGVKVPWCRRHKCVLWF